MAISSTSGQGRRKGSKNRVNLKREAEVAASGLTPLEFMLDVLRDPDRPFDARQWAAIGAAPYVHPKLATTTLKGDETAPIIHEIRRQVIKPLLLE